ncbi:hypothetical protein PN478_02265 [Dolichospermum circinale CS-534/05]|uniref:hypothetical protein n=1 Tax=Dolichospermum circinale TaxID=109265 RepID=UPI00232E28E8|nr:hypothetical protein [Dolichospermum circinale]MDB9489355.1 hypothetical protein [Dolichospermum circinale CS-534/05]
MPNNIFFNERGNHNGDNVAGDKNTNYAPTNSSSDILSNKQEIVELLEELRKAIKTSSVDEDTKDSVVGKVATAIKTTKNTDVKTLQDAKKIKDQISQSIKTTTEIFKGVGDVSNILTILSSIAKLLGLPIP